MASIQTVTVKRVHIAPDVDMPVTFVANKRDNTVTLSAKGLPDLLIKPVKGGMFASVNTCTETVGVQHDNPAKVANYAVRKFWRVPAAKNAAA